MTRALLAPLQWQDEALLILDQRLLPQDTHWIRCVRMVDAVQTIANMAVRGAPAIGLTGAYALALARREGLELAAAARTIKAARPTAVHLAWAVDAAMAAVPDGDPAQLLALAQAMQAEDAQLNQRMAEHGAALLPPGGIVITHCNTGALATGGWGTALGVIRTAHAQGRVREVIVDETRPWLQGARLTAWELAQEGIPHRLIADGAAAWAMRQLRPSWVIVGADRIAANGDAANKIGTFSLAVLARSLGVKMMVVAPLATIDWGLAYGHGIPIEERSASELTSLRGQPLAPAQTPAWNPVFDVTPAHLIDALVTEAGVVLQPDARKLAAWRRSQG
nr:S-methyl-5-thioribose-1-phosphate isomerase [Oceanococcus sp. HetDA_MAG_MS8]